MANSDLCSIQNCGKPADRRGWCRAHYIRWHRHGDPLEGRTAVGDPLRFLNDVVMAHEAHECITWPYSRESQGRGIIKLGGKMELVHRVVCERVNGAPPTPEHHAAHSCGKGHLGCISPKHLSWKTCAENMADKLIHGTHQRGERVGTSKLTESDVIQILALKGKKPVKELASEFGVTKEAIYRIHSRTNWSWVSHTSVTTKTA